MNEELLPLPVIRQHLARGGPSNFSKALDVHRDRSIFNVTKDGNTYTAECISSAEAGVHYNLWAELARNAVMNAFCNCPVGGDGRCKHVGALLLHVRDAPAARLGGGEEIRRLPPSPSKQAPSPLASSPSPSPSPASPASRALPPSFVASSVIPGVTRLTRQPSGSPLGKAQAATQQAVHTTSPERDVLIKRLEGQINDLRRILQERDVQLATERQMREEAEARAAAAEALLKRAESAPTQSPTPQLADDGPTQIMEDVSSLPPTQLLPTAPQPPLPPPKPVAVVGTPPPAQRKVAAPKRTQTRHSHSGEEEEAHTYSPVKKVLRPLVAESQGSEGWDQTPSAPTPSEDEFAALASRHLKQPAAVGTADGARPPEEGDDTEDQATSFITSLLQRRR